MTNDDRSISYLQTLPNIGQSGQWQQNPFPPQMVTIPMTADNWKKLSRETQIKMLDELGILNGG